MIYLICLLLRDDLDHDLSGMSEVWYISYNTWYVEYLLKDSLTIHISRYMRKHAAVEVHPFFVLVRLHV